MPNNAPSSGTQCQPDGNLFLPVRAEIRKKIKKEEGDLVYITLYYDNEPLEVPEEMLLCIKEEPVALAFCLQRGLFRRVA